jgi:tight adherence protein B
LYFRWKCLRNEFSPVCRNRERDREGSKMSGLITVALAFLAGVLIVYACNLVVSDLFQRDQEELRSRVQEETEQRQREAAAQAIVVKQKLSEMAEEAWDETTAAPTSLREKLREMVEQSGLNLTVNRLLYISLALFAVVGLTAGFFSRNSASGGAAGLLAGALPFMYVQMKRQERMNKLLAQLPDAFDLMGRVLRAGQTIGQAIHAVSTEFKAPIAIEFGYCYEQQNLGLSPDYAFRDLGRRTGLLEIKVFVLAMLIQRQTGGNLTELLDKLSMVVRERYRMRCKVQGLTAEGKFQAAILGGLPLLVFAALLVVNRPYALKLFDHPVLPIGSAVSLAIGMLWIRKIINFDF